MIEEIILFVDNYTKIAGVDESPDIIVVDKDIDERDEYEIKHEDLQY